MFIRVKLLLHFLRFFLIISGIMSQRIKDEFTVRLMDIYRRLKNQENKQTIKLGIYRSDYMIHVEYDTENRTFSTHLRQIEINSIAASFSHLAQLATRLHS